MSEDTRLLLSDIRQMSGDISRLSSGIRLVSDDILRMSDGIFDVSNGISGATDCHGGLFGERLSSGAGNHQGEVVRDRRNGGDP